ncbi:hypothetical protein [Candidatus Clostridium radicumherbarum]|uniref:Uncharacterized protein n=1 Tax=Candidatus Clostridium radicumherbarum TaxID=3381662 RepID=A0ABW8TZB4_9CLOT
MGNLVGEVVYNKFINETVKVKIYKSIVDRLIVSSEIFYGYLEEELQHTLNPCLKEDMKSIEKITEELQNNKSTNLVEKDIMLTVSEFLIFRYAVENTAPLTGTVILNNKQSIEYMDFVIGLDKINDTLDTDEIKDYYEFLSSYDVSQFTILN